MVVKATEVAAMVVEEREGEVRAAAMAVVVMAVVVASTAAEHIARSRPQIAGCGLYRLRATS